MESLSLTLSLPGTPDAIFSAWLNAPQHSEFSGQPARIEPFIEGTFHLRDGFITGRNLFIEKNAQTIQAWRNADFPPESPASELELRFEKMGNDTLLTLHHRHIPAGMGEEMRQFWLEDYFERMKTYFTLLNQGPAAP